MLKGFKEFILRGNVIELAVAVVIGAAFNAVVEKVVDALINPLISAVFQADALDNALVLTLPGDSKLMFGAVIGALLNFLIVAAVVYFAFVLPMNKMKERNAEKPEEETVPNETDLLAEIRDLLHAQNEAASARVGGHGVLPEHGVHGERETE
ncbi:MAG: large conductance mechanosensitive channel protein MscL [Canibacter sp.]